MTTQAELAAARRAIWDENPLAYTVWLACVNVSTEDAVEIAKRIVRAYHKSPSIRKQIEDRTP